MCHVSELGVGHGKMNFFDINFDRLHFSKNTIQYVMPRTPARGEGGYRLVLQSEEKQNHRVFQIWAN